jgi:hypothetical protein
MRTYPYLVLAVGGASDRRANKEVVLMSHENGTPANRRPLAALYTMLGVVLVVVLAATVVGPGRAIDWLGTYLIPVMVILGVVFAAWALLVWALKRLPDPPYREPVAIDSITNGATDDERRREPYTRRVRGTLLIWPSVYRPGGSGTSATPRSGRG